jgi:hypothetical protein
MIFDIDDDEVPDRDHVSDQEEEEPIDNNAIPQTYTSPTRTTIEPGILAFGFSSQDRQSTEGHETYKAEVTAPLAESTHP